MASLKELFVTLWRDFLDFIFPPSCQLCGETSENTICPKCESSLKSLDSGYCMICNGKVLPNQPKCGAHHEKNGVNIDFVRPLASFDEEHRKLIHLFKYSSVVELANFFGERIGKMIVNEKNFSDFDVFVPVPLHKNRQKERRFNQAELLANVAAQVSNRIVCKNAVQRIKNTDSQTKQRNANERAKNVSDAFAIVEPQSVVGHSVIIIDDVVTSGATITEIAKELKMVGVKRICAVCIAHPMEKSSKESNI